MLVNKSKDFDIPDNQPFPFVLGNLDVIERLKTLALEDQFPQVILFYGKKGLGKSLVARYVAKILLCQSFSACGSCQNCRLSETHKDFLYLDSSEDTIKKQEADLVAEHLLYRGQNRLGQSWRIAVVIDIDKLTDQAANRLLKTLEECPKNSSVVMSTSRMNHVLPTILSRSHKIALSPASYEISRQALISQLKLNKISAEEQEIEQSLKLSGCAVGEAFNLMTQGKGLNGEVSRLLRNLLAHPDWVEKFKIAETLGKQKKIQVRELKKEIEMVLNHSYRSFFGLATGADQGHDCGISVPAFKILKQRRALLSRVNRQWLAPVAQNSQLFLEALASQNAGKTNFWSENSSR